VPEIKAHKPNYNPLTTFPATVSKDLTRCGEFRARYACLKPTKILTCCVSVLILLWVTFAVTFKS